jgi:hypothetical protein
MAHSWSELGAGTISTERAPSVPRLAKLGLVVFAALGAAIGLAHAQQQAASGGQGMRQACQADFKAMCSGVSPGGGRIVACLQQHAAGLSPGCQNALAAAQAPR